MRVEVDVHPHIQKMRDELVNFLTTVEPLNILQPSLTFEDDVRNNYHCQKQDASVRITVSRANHSDKHQFLWQCGELYWFTEVKL